MKRILILGGTGHLGKVIVKDCLDKNYQVTTLVRNSSKLNIKDKNLKIIIGNVTDEKDLANALADIDAVISVLGHGFRTSFPIQEKTFKNLIPLMEQRKIKRLITITGAGLKIKGDPHSLTANISEIIFKLIDPYRINDAKNQQNLLEKSNLDWTVVRTPVHNDKTSNKISKIGFNQPPIWKTVSRNAISEFMINCLENNEWIKKSPIIY